MKKFIQRLFNRFGYQVMRTATFNELKRRARYSPEDLMPPEILRMYDHAATRESVGEYLARKAEQERCAHIAENPGFIEARDTEWDDGVNFAKRFIAVAIRDEPVPLPETKYGPVDEFISRETPCKAEASVQLVQQHQFD